MATKLTRLTYKIALKLHLVAESCTICSPETSGYTLVHLILNHKRMRTSEVEEQLHLSV